MRVELALVYRPNHGRPLSLATIADRDILRLAAQAAINEGQDRIGALEGQDSLLAMLEAQELEKLRQALAILMPDFAFKPQKEVERL